jgi:hypothetical protein
MTHSVRYPDGIIETAVLSQQIPLPHPPFQVDKHFRECGRLVHCLLKDISLEFERLEAACLPERFLLR